MVWPSTPNGACLSTLHWAHAAPTNYTPLPPTPDRRKQQLNQLSPVDSRSPRPSEPPPATPLRRHHHDSPPRLIRPITRTPDLELLEALLDDRVLVLLQLLRVRHVLRDPRATHTRSSAASNSPDATRAPSTRPARARRFPVNDRKNIDAVRLGSRPLKTTTSQGAPLPSRGTKARRVAMADRNKKTHARRWQTPLQVGHESAPARHRCRTLLTTRKTYENVQSSVAPVTNTPETNVPAVCSLNPSTAAIATQARARTPHHRAEARTSSETLCDEATSRACCEACPLRLLPQRRSCRCLAGDKGEKGEARGGRATRRTGGEVVRDDGDEREQEACRSSVFDGAARRGARLRRGQAPVSGERSRRPRARRGREGGGGVAGRRVTRAA